MLARPRRKSRATLQTMTERIDRSAPRLLTSLAHDARFVGAVLGVLGIACAACWASQLAPGETELGALARVERARDLLRWLASEGPGELFSKVGHQRVAKLGFNGVLRSVASAWFTLLLEDWGFVPSLAAHRSFNVLLGGLGPAALYFFVRPAGSMLALAAAGLWCLTPGFFQSVATGGTTLVVLWLICIGCYLRTHSTRGFGPRELGFALASGAAHGAAVAHSAASLWVLVVLVAHHLVQNRRRSLSGLRLGWVELPTALVVGAPAAILVAFALQPRAWQGSLLQIVKWFTLPLRVRVGATPYAGDVVDSEPVPAALRLLVWVAAVPVSLTLLSVLGVVARSRWCGARLTDRRPDPAGVHRACALVVGLLVLLGALAPGLLARWPPRVQEALPFAAALAAFGVRALWSTLPGRGPRWAFGLCLLVGLGGASLISPTTASAHHGLVVGGTGHVTRTRLLRPSNRTELFGLGRRLLACRGRVRVYSPELPQRWWDRFAALMPGDCEVRTTPGARGARFSVLRAPHAGAGSLLGRVRRGRAILWELRRLPHAQRGPKEEKPGNH